jgi:hypothetical protein
MFKDIAAIAAGYLVSVGAGYLVVQQVMEAAWRGALAPLGSERAAATRAHPEHAQAVGLVERALYTAAWHLGVREFIAVWLALKVAGRWHGWSEDRPGQPGGRTGSDLFLIGSGLSLAFGVAGALVAEWLARDAWVEALLLVVALVGASLGLRWFLERKPVSAG